MLHSHLVVVACSLFLTLLVGCGGPSRHQAIVREQIAAYTELEETLATVKDAASMEAARTKLKAREHVFEEVARKAASLASPSEAALAAMLDDVRRFKLTQERVQYQVRRILALPGGRDFLAQFQGVNSFLPQD